MRAEPNQQSAFLNPLAAYYATCGAALPRAEAVEPADMPQPQRRLLVHSNDMTPTLEAYGGQRLRLRIVHKAITGPMLTRTVSLVGLRDARPLEFGVIRIHLDRFDQESGHLIRQCHLPLGAILRDAAIEHRSRPIGFFHLRCDPFIASALELTGTPPLYGRHNELIGADERRLAQVVEILPPWRED